MSKRVGLRTMSSIQVFTDRALRFDGVDDYVEVAHAPSLNFGTGAFSVLALVKAAVDLRTEQPTFIQKRETTWFRYWFLGIDWNGYGEFSLTDGYVDTEPTQKTMDDNEWHFWAGVRGEDYIALYIDGVLQDSKSIVPSNLDTTEKLYIGGDPLDQLFWGDSIIDNILIYNRALTLAEIQRNMIARTPVLSSLVLRLPMNDGSGGVVRDKSGYGNNGVLKPDYPTSAPRWVVGNRRALI